MRECSVCRKLEIVPGSRADYEELSHLHYRESRLGPFSAIFVLRPSAGTRLGSGTVGVIVYRMPTPAAELRNIATGGFFGGFDRRTRLALINKNIRCISRVIIEPRFRSLGLASRLVRETLPKMNVPIVEALAVMGLVNPFFEKAGMKAFTAAMPERCVRLTEALSIAGVREQELIEPLKVQTKLDRLNKEMADFIEAEMCRFLQSYGSRRYSNTGLERTRYVLSRLTERPVYYIWFNPQMVNGNW